MSKAVPVLSRRLYAAPQRSLYRLGGLILATGLLAHAVAAHWGLVAGLAEALLVLAVVHAGPAAMYVRADAEGVTVRNVIRVHRVPWGDVRGFTLDDRFPYLAYLDVADGRELPVLAIADDPWITGPRAHERNIAMLEGLNGLWRSEVIRATTGVMPGPAPATAP